jgi:hypothetical protein
MNALNYTHAIFAWLLLILLVLSLVIAVSRYKKKISLGFSKVYLVTMILAHLQVLLGLTQYFISSKVVHSKAMMSDSLLRFFALEHPLMMIIGIVVLTIGYSKSKNHVFPNKSVFIYYAIGLIFILSRFPWQYLTVTF